MRSALPDYFELRLAALTGAERLDLNGDKHFALVEEAVLNAAEASVIALDLRGLSYLGYSYAKRVVREVVLRRNEGLYGERRIFIVADQGDDFLDGLRAAFRDLKLFSLVSPDPGSLVGARLIGDVPDYMQETFQVVARTAPVPTGSLAKLLGQSPQNAKNRLDRLFEMGLLRREKAPSPSGGLEWVNSIF